jgi:hypothetical protein
MLEPVRGPSKPRAWWLAMMLFAVSGTSCGPSNTGKRSAARPVPARAVAAPAAAALSPAERIAERVVVIRDGMLSVLEVPHGRVSVLARWAPDWCGTDGGGSWVWATRATGDGLELHALEGSGQDHLLATSAPGTAAPKHTSVVVEYPDGSYVGAYDPVSPEVALRVRVRPPSVAAELYCEGDASWYCYDDQKRLLPELERTRAALGRVTLSDKAFLLHAAAKGAGTKLFSRADDAGQRPVDSTRCAEDPAACGKAHPLGSTSYQLVVVANARGDYFHEAMQLYEPRRGEFFSVHDPKLRSPTPFPGHDDVEGMHVSPSGAFYTSPPHVTKTNGQVNQVHAFDGSVSFSVEGVCGWLGGGLRVGGPRER